MQEIHTTNCEYMTQDQRFAFHRPDVLQHQLAVDEDLTVAGRSPWS